MKQKYIGLILGVLALTSGASFATITLNTQFGQAFSSSSVPVPDGTLWALIVDDGVGTLPGGMLTNGSGLSAANALNSSLVNSTFSGASIGLGTSLGGDIVFAMGAFNGANDLSVPGSTTNSLGFTLGTNGLVAGRAIGFYFFPGVTYTAAGTYNVGSQVGGISTLAADAGAGTVGMVVPADGATIFMGANTDGDGGLGGSLTNSAFTAVNVTAIPEPSAALLGAIGALGLLRRRRI